MPLPPKMTMKHVALAAAVLVGGLASCGESDSESEPQATGESDAALLPSATNGADFLGSEEAARAAGEVLHAAFRRGGLEIERKSEHDFVTSADRAAEEAILEVLGARCPDDQVLTEESGLLGEGAAYQWVVDPLDGTTNFLRGLPMYAVSAAVTCAARSPV